MYGPDDSDLLVKYYDESLGMGSEAERQWYLAKARQFGGPVLDIACGTGRLALALLEQGLEVTCVDRSEGMLHQLRRKLEGAAPDTARRATVRNQTMAEFALDRKFNTVICCDAFFHNLTVDEETSCLRCVAQHLTRARFT